MSGSMISKGKARTEASNFRVLARIKRGVVDGVDTRPDLTAEECEKIAREWEAEIDG